ncbi:hypothetical protein AAS21_gp176 [Pantoea phage vB_PagS_AAS21]|uniref:Uncharacterized protein n=1 Tax=Pantoea phage vB_PagS_AAS21 TaxID=2575261 RepID=A0A4Y5P1S1_9CAUD|nr:hypothetical protein AAS21_gp176 [Pantoea phage vB_PagS_AAS21]
MTEEEKQEIIDEYNAAMFASNEAGYAGITAEQTIRYLMERVKESESKLAELAKQKPIGWLNDAYLGRGVIDGEVGEDDFGPGYIPIYRHPFNDVPAPAVDLANLVPDALSWSYNDNISQGEVLGWNACRAEILRKLKEHI